MNCGEMREIAAHSLCFKCYRAAERAQKATPDPVWARLGNGWLLREQKRAFTVITGILKAIADCPTVGDSDRKQIQVLLRPYLDKLAECFAPKARNGKQVNCEQKRARSLRSLTEAEGDGLSNQVQPSGEEQ